MCENISPKSCLCTWNNSLHIKQWLSRTEVCSSQMWTLVCHRSRIETCRDWYVKTSFLSNSATNVLVILSVPMSGSPSGRSSSAAQKRSLPKQRKQPDLLRRPVLARQTPAENNRGPAVETRNLKWVLFEFLLSSFWVLVSPHPLVKFETVEWWRKGVTELLWSHKAVRVWRCLVQMLKIALFQEFRKDKGRFPISVCKLCLSRFPPDGHGPKLTKLSNGCSMV